MESVKRTIENSEKSNEQRIANDKAKAQKALGFDAARVLWDGKVLKKYIMRSYLKMLRVLYQRRLRLLERFRKMKLKWLLKRMRSKQSQTPTDDTANPESQKHVKMFSRNDIEQFKLGQHLSSLAGSDSLAFKLITMQFQDLLRNGYNHNDSMFYMELEKRCKLHIDHLLLNKEITSAESLGLLQWCMDYTRPLYDHYRAQSVKNDFFRQSSGMLRDAWAKYFEYLHKNTPDYSQPKKDLKGRFVMQDALKKQIHAKGYETGVIADYKQKGGEPIGSFAGDAPRLTPHRPSRDFSPSRQPSPEKRAAQPSPQSRISSPEVERPAVTFLDRLRRFVFKPRVQQDFSVLRINNERHTTSSEFAPKPGSVNIPAITRDVKAYHMQRQQVQESQSPILSNGMFSKVPKPMPDFESRKKDPLDNSLATKHTAPSPVQGV